jgi:hypothetical protein
MLQDVPLETFAQPDRQDEYGGFDLTADPISIL